MSTMFRDISSVSAMPGHIEPPSRVFGITAGKTTLRSSLLPREPNRPNRHFGISNSVDYMPNQNYRTSTVQSTTLDVRQFGLQSRNVTSDSGFIPEGSFRFNQTMRQKSNNTSNISKAFWPAVRNTTLTTGLRMQDSLRYNDDIIDNGGFRRPTAMRIIRGRNSTLSSRLLGSQNGDRHYKDLSNINGFNVSHISRREVDTLSESRLPLSSGNCWMENRSITGSVLSTVSMKAQFMNVLENLHHSILSIGPNVTTEAIRVEFDKAKEGLENISEMSFAPTIRPAEAASVISHSSKYRCPSITEQPVSNTLDGGSFQLKSSTDLLKTLMSSKKDYINKFGLSTHEEEGAGEKDITSSQDKEFDDEEELNTVFKKPKSYPKKRRSLRHMKIKVSQVAKNLLSKGTNKAVNLREWYPIAVGSDLALCGVDENGAPVKTEAVKKRLSSRKVELVSGLICNLIGNASTMVSALPRKIMASLKNGLPDRWRVLQKELLNSQTAEEERKKRISKSPKAVLCSPKKRNVVVDKSPKRKVKEVNSPVVKVKSSPKKKQNEIQTRSGRTVKPPSMFWLGTGSNEVTSSLAVSEKMKQEESSSKKSRGILEETSTKKSAKQSGEYPSKNERESEKSRSQRGKPLPVFSPRKGKKAKKYSPKKPKGKQSKAKSPKETKEESSEEVRVHSSTEDAKRQIKTRSQGGKRKREVTGDTDSVQAKKSKLEKKWEEEVEVESTVETTEIETKTGKKKGGRSPRSPTSKRQKSPRVKNKKETTKKCQKVFTKVTESKNGGTIEKQTELAEFEDLEMSGFVEFEKNFELKLGSIEIPEIEDPSGNPQLSRSQLRLVSMETPPLKYFNNNLRLIRSSTATPVRSPDWCPSQRTESEVKQFQRRREGALKKKINMNVKREVLTEKSTKTVQNKDVKRVMEWVAEKTVKSPRWNSKVLRYILPSRKAMEEDNDEDIDTEFF